MSSYIVQRHIVSALPPPPPPEELWAIARVHGWRSAQKRRKKIGSSVAYKTIGTVLSQE